MKKCFVIFLVFIFQSFSSFGEWKPVIKNIKGSVFYVDFERVRNIDGYIHYWTLIDYNRTLKNGLKSEKNYRKVDCKNYRFMFLDGFLYYGPMGNGKYIKGKLNYGWIYVPPKSVHEKILNMVC